MLRFGLRALAACTIGISFAACSGGSSALTAASPSRSATDDTDRAFVPGAAMASNSEISDAQLALTVSSNPDVISFANLMINNHTGENEALDPIGTMIGEPPPTGVGPPMAQTHATLETLSGTAFDAFYINSEIAGHTANLDNNYMPELATGSNVELIGYAHTYDPQVTHHLTLAESIKAKYGF